MRRTFPILLIVSGLGLSPARAEKPDDDLKGTIAYVKRLQSEGGGFFAVEPKPEIRQQPTLRATSAAVRALKYLGADVPNKEECKKFIASCYDKASGGFADVPNGKPDVFTTAVGIMAAADLGLADDPYTTAPVKYLADNAKRFDDIRIAVAGLERIKKESPKKVAWSNVVCEIKVKTDKIGEPTSGVARDLGSWIVTFFRLGGRYADSATEAKIDLLRKGQRLNGGYGKEGTASSDLESTYRVMRAFVMLKGQPKNVEGVRSFVAKCRNEDGGYGISPGENSNVSATYFAAIIRHWLKEMK